MKIGELVRCPRCNSENPPEYRFCGMCGTPLDKPVEPPVRSAEPVRPVERVREPERPSSSESLSGPSFLGLSQPASGTEDVTYLFEEEQPKRTYWRFILLLLILGIVGGLGWLQYTRSGKSWTAPWANQKPTTPEQAAEQSTAPAAPSPTNSAAQQPAANAPANSPSQNTPGNPTPPKETEIAPGSTPQTPAGTQGPAAAAPAPAQQPPQSSTTAENKPAEATPGAAKVEKNDNSGSAAASSAGAAADNSEDENSADETPVTKPKASRPKAAPAAAANPDDALVANAEKYLYGRGVPQNCDRALVSLRAAADRQNARAQSLLGTMYGTGHCVPRDLPNAYRWFAVASRQQSDNMWIQRNLEMIWREMTPQERQLAMQSNR